MFAQQSTNASQSRLRADNLTGASVWQAIAPEEITNLQAHKHPSPKIREHDWIIPLFYLTCDIVCWVLLYGLVGYVRRDAFFVTPFEFFLVDLVTLAVILQSLYIIGGYSRYTEMRSLTYTTEHILAVAAAAAVSSLLIYSTATFDQTMKPSRGVLLVSFMAFLPISLVYRRVFRQLFAASAAQRAFLVIGSGELASRFYQAYRQSPNQQQQLEFVDNDVARVGSAIAGEGSPIIQGGIAARLAQLDGRYSGVILAESIEKLGPELLERLVRTQFQRTRVYTLESFYEAHWRHVPVHTIDPFWPLQMGFQLARISPYHYLKRVCDLLFSATLLLIFAPLFLLIFLLIWMENGRPAIFRQSRVGREGHIFMAYKFRTMFMRDQNGATEERADLYTRKGDPRVTRVGRWLRKLRLDELPQLWNVFKGDMSLIGPRAEWVRCAEQYEKGIPFYHFRHLVKPGITGWAQVNYPYGESDEDAVEKLQYDLYYIRHYSLKLDAMIVLKTVHTMLFGKGR